MMDQRHLVAHRGLPTRYPGNSLEGFQAALALGARYLECDLQISADGVPVLFHDANLKRAVGIDAPVSERPWALLKGLTFRGRHHPPIGLAPLEDLVALMAAHPYATLFVEIKRAALRAGGADRVVDRILEMLTPIERQCVVISFHAGALRRVRSRRPCPIGWIFETWGSFNQRQAERLQPDYLFTDQRRIPHPHVLYSGPWRWVLYVIDDVPLAQRWLKRGAALVETNQFQRMIADPASNPLNGAVR